MTLSLIKKYFQKYKPRKINFWDYRYFQNNAFREKLLPEILNLNVEISEKRFTEIFFETCNKHLNCLALCK